MRHFFGLLLGVVVAAALLLGGGWASQELVRGAAQIVDPAKDTRMLIAIGVMALVGLLLGLVLVGRVSPLATFIPSMALLAWTVVYVLDVSRAASLVPTGPSVQAELLQAGRGTLMLLSSGVYALLGVALFLPVLMPSRWARPEQEEEEEEYEESYGF
ncbi:hypothetical protein [Microbispora hainanensis]|uniref:Uncharacterized protein n=1 Tax=Microbispora hainanensis TaxID=568844 RepID=A0A544YRI7_9ACTN|nr:hypothetical protein [Microbispora hainanensis]TQS19400.1 hypothetical protein FLX08_20310 [Microbispora hainanensis]